MSERNEQALVWRNDVDVAQFSEEAQVAYAEYKDAQRKAAQLRKAFEDMAVGELNVPAGHKVAFGYKFGKLSIGFGKGEQAAPKAGKAQVSLSEWMAQQAASGQQA